MSIRMSIILISPYGSNDLLIRFTHSAVRQFKIYLLFLPKWMQRVALVGRTKWLFFTQCSEILYAEEGIKG